MFKTFVALGSINLFLGVALGAFGAHALKGRIPEDLLAVWNTGVHYQMIHALGLILIGILTGKLGETPWVNGAGWALFAGIILFSGSLYLLSLTGVRSLGMITPLGGLAFLAGWLLLAVAAIRS